jgi:hypothetical protein
MARSEGLTLAPWGALGSGKTQMDAEETHIKENSEEGQMLFGAEWERTLEQKIVRDMQIAREAGTESITSSKWGSPIS